MSEFRFPDPSERQKRARLLEFLDVGKVMVYVDPRQPGIDLPAHLRRQVAVPLNLSHHFGLETFEIGPLAVRASLSFGGERHLCVLPYKAMFSFHCHGDGRRQVFPDAVPPDVAVVDAPPAPAPVASGEGDTTAGSEATEAHAEEPTSAGPTLRLVE